MTHLGRNPFGKATSYSEPKTEKIKQAGKSKRIEQMPARWLLVDLPAAAYIMALKTFFLVRGVFQGK